jgi:hypothetical protein
LKSNVAPSRARSPDGEPRNRQFYQFAGRADVVAWNVEERALLHIEIRTRFPDLQEMAGSTSVSRLCGRGGAA